MIYNISLKMSHPTLPPVHRIAQLVLRSRPGSMLFFLAAATYPGWQVIGIEPVEDINLYN